MEHVERTAKIYQSFIKFHLYNLTEKRKLGRPSVDGKFIFLCIFDELVVKR